MRRATLIIIIGLAASLVACGVGLVLLRNEPGSLTAFGILGAGIAGFLACSRWQDRHSLTEEEVSLVQKHVFATSIWVASFTMLLTVLLSLGSKAVRSAPDNQLNAALWIISVLLPVGFFIWKEEKFLQLKEKVLTWLKENWREVIAVMAIVLVGFVLRAYDIGYHPYPWSGDEFSIGTEGRRILNGNVTDFYSTGWSGQPNWSFVGNALALRVWGENIVSIRMISVLTGSLSILTVYLLARELFNSRIGLIAAGFLAGFPYHLHFSRLGVHNIVDSLTVTLTLWLVLRAARKGNKLAYVLAGIASGLTIYTYVGSRLVLALAFGTGLILLLNHRGFLKENWRQILTFFGVLILTMGPMAFYFAIHPDQFMTRIGQESILSNNWIGQEAERLGVSVWNVLLSQFTKSTLVYISQPAYGNFFGSPQPYLTVFGSILGLLGMVISWLDIRKTGNSVLQMWFWAVVFLGSVLTLNPPANTRLVMTTPAVAIFIGIGLAAILDTVRKLQLLTSTWREWILAGTILGILLVQNSIFYFIEYRVNYYFHDANAELAMEAGQILQDLGPEEYSLYMLGAPRVFSGFPTLQFLAPTTVRVDATFQEDAIQPGLAYDSGAFFVAIPENLGQLEMIRIKYPDGKWIAIERLAKEEILFYGYIIEPEEMREYAPEE